MQKNHTENWQDLLSADFSAESKKKDEIKQALLQRIQQQETSKHEIQEEDFTMHQTNQKRFKRPTIVALIACLSIVTLSATAYGIIKHLNLGQHAQYITNTSGESEIAEQMEEPLPAELQGLLYSKDGKIVEKIGDMEDGVYNAAGEAVVIINDDFGNLLIETEEESSQRRAQATTLFSSLKEAQPYLAFDVRPLAYVPEDYELEGYRVYNNENGQPNQNTKYMEMYFYKNGNADEHIYVQARFMDEETAFVSSGSNSIEKTSINGHEAMLDGSNVDILIGDVMYMIISRNLPQSEVIKMAESLTK